MRWCSSPASSLVLLLFSFFTLFLGREEVSGFRICSYNLQQYNLTKSANYRMLHTMTRVVSRCDICLLQNVLDPSHKAMKKLMGVLNRYDEEHYALVSSKPLGKSPNDMQQYVFVYRNQVVQNMGYHQYDSKNVFARDPFVVKFRSEKTNIKDFILVPLHSDESNVVKEIDKLYDVFVEVSKKWNNTNVMFLGDFHTACGYVTRADKKKIRLFTDSTFTWLIKDRQDTTVNSKISCAYDRIVVYGQEFLRGIKPFSAKAFNFAEEFKITREMALEVSDHLPVEVALKDSAPAVTPLLILLGLAGILQLFLAAL